MNRKGSLFESALIGELLQQGFHIPRRDPALDHTAKLDFVIHRFPGSIMHHQLGVQLTIGEKNNVKKMSEFLAVHSGMYEKGVQRSMYIQAEEDIDIPGGGAYVIGSAITHFQFSRDLASERVIGLEVQEDLSYNFFPIKDRVAETVAAEKSQKDPTPPTVGTQPSKTPASSKLSISSRLEGELTYWIPEESGYGYILGQDNETYYLHAYAISDGQLHGILQSVQQRTRYPIQQKVEFEIGTKNKPSDKYLPAKNVRIATGKPFPR